MKVHLPGLRLDTSAGKSDVEGLVPPTWPPHSDYPVVVDAEGNVVSRFSDPTWNLSLWAGRTLRVAFGDGDQKQGAKLSPGNADLLRMVSAWWLYGPEAVRTAQTLAARHVNFKPIFVVCSEEGILASELSRFPRVIEKISGRLHRSEGRKIFAQLHDLYAAREELGFEILDEAGLRQLSALLPGHQTEQTAYIPPRIWSYQVVRLRQCLDDYLAHREKIEACYRFCLEAYKVNARGNSPYTFMKQIHKPFEPSISPGTERDGRRFHGAFRLTAERFGIDELFERWIGWGDAPGIRVLPRYLSLVSYVGLAYILNFSLMRIDEGARMRVGCLDVERDVLGDDIYTISGVTTKTIADDDARWIVSPSAEVAIEAMTSVVELRMEATRLHPEYKGGKKDEESPLLLSRIHEPWKAGAKKVKDERMVARSYSDVIGYEKKLFDPEQLRITQADLTIARQMNLDLDSERYDIGKVWPLSWHQLRRTGACNMLATGLVTEGALQYQLKHASRAMSLYYGQNHYKLKTSLDDDARGYYLREMYQAVVRDFSALQGDDHLSPHGDKRKSQIIEMVSEKDHKALLRSAEQGKISYRETFLGGCTKPGPACPLGGISNITGCMGCGEDPACAWVMLDKTKRPIIARLRSLFQNQLNGAAEDSPLTASIRAQIESAERALYVIDNA